MNPLRRLGYVLCLSLTASTAFANETVLPELRGVLATGSERRFALALPGGDTAWLTVGSKFAGWTLTEFRPSEDVLVLVKNGQETKLKLSSSKITEADVKATLADAEDVLTKMKFEEMFTKILEQQKKSVIEMTRSMTAKTPGADPADVAAFQAKVMDTIFAEMQPDEMKADFAKIYSEVFTKSELKGLADFYGTAAGQALTDKQPEVQKRTMEMMMPRMMKGMAKVGPMTTEFAKQQAAKKAAAAPATPAAPAAPAAPSAP